MLLADLSIKKPVMIIMVMIALFLFGVLAYVQIPLNLMPDTKVPYISIQTIYGGATPDQIESQITTKIEDEISSIGGLESIMSYSMDSVSLITLEFALDKDADTASQEVKEKVDAILNDLPDDADTPVISKMDLTATAVMTLVLQGNRDPAELYGIANTTVKDKLSRIPGIGNVDIEGGQDEEIRIIFNDDRVYEYHLNLLQIGGILDGENHSLPGGSFKNENQEYSVNFKGEFRNMEEIANQEIPTNYGYYKLNQLASVEMSPADGKKRITYYSGDESLGDANCVLLSIVKSSDGNSVEIAKELKKELASINKALPHGSELSIVSDDSVLVEDTVKDTQSSILLGILFTSLVLLFFLHDIRSTIIAALSMPLSIIPTFIILNLLGISMNEMSLMGISTSVGVLVMNSVVVLENIFRHKSLGNSPAKAASIGAKEVAVAVFASTLTNVCVFLPLGTMGGIAGMYLKDFALTVVISTVFSLLVSFTLTPMLASRLLPENIGKKNGFALKIEAFFQCLERGYKSILTAILKNKKRSALLVGLTFVLFIVSLAGFTRVPIEFTPVSDSGKILVEAELPQDASLDQTAEKITEIEDILKTFDDVDRFVTTLGALSALDSGTNLAKIQIVLKGKATRTKTTQEITEEMDRSLKGITNARIRVKVAGDKEIDSSSVSFYLQAEDSETLKKYVPLYLERLEALPELRSAETSLKAGKPEINIYPDREKLREFGVNVQTLSTYIRASVDGLVMTELKSGDKAYDVRIMLDRSDVSSYEDIENIPITLSSGVYPLSFFADIEIENGVSKLLRTDKLPTAEIIGSLRAGVAQSEVTTQITALHNELNGGEVTLKWSSVSDLMNESTASMGIAFIMAILLTYMLLAAVLGKFGQPLLILSTVPLSLIGVVSIFLITGFAMNIISMLAIIMLVGMVVNNAILILEYTNQLQEGGMAVKEALLTACPTKLQPILMSNIATILGMLPMALGLGDTGVEMRQPMGLVSTGGLIAATFLSLFLIPALEYMLGRKKKPSVSADLVLKKDA